MKADTHNYKHTLRVYYEDTDCGRIVYHANFLKFMERSRTEWLYHLGYGDKALHGYGIGFAVTSVDLHFKQPAKVGQLLEVSAAVSASRRASMTFSHEIYCKKTGALVCKGKVHVACLNENLKPCRIPAELLEALTGE